MRNCLRTLLALFQQADYDPILFRAWLARHPTPKDWATFEKKSVLRWTVKARILFFIASAKSIGIPRLAPPMLLFAQSVIQPFEKIAIWAIARRARKKLRKVKFREVIGITGSFGKTTVKEMLAHTLAAKFRAHKTPENKNTLLGIARWILSKSDFHSGDILILEMGAYRRGDIAAICRMARPTVGVLTGLNEAHLERFGSLENTFWTKAELIQALPPGAALFWNESSPLLKNFLEKHRARWRNVRLTPFDGDAASAAAAIAEHFGFSDVEIADRLRAFRPAERRFAETRAPGNRLVIDDTYNITLDGARRAVGILKTIPRRRVGVFAGIPEAGRATEDVNKELGQLIAAAFDLVLLRHTPYEEFVRSGLRLAEFPEKDIVAYTETSEVQPLLAGVVKDGDCVYFSAYDLPAIYL